MLFRPKRLVATSPEVHFLGPRQSREFDLHVDFQQQLAPLKLVVCCNRKSYVVKLVPDIGAFLRPKVLSFEDFATAESRLVGMFETTNRYFPCMCICQFISGQCSDWASLFWLKMFCREGNKRSKLRST